MPRTTTNKSVPKPNLIQDKGSDFVWAAITIVSLPIVALSLTALNFHPIWAFLIACSATLIIIIIEALVRGKLWIFQQRYQNLFEQSDMAFRILIVAGGILLVLQTVLIVEALRNPDFDHVMLNVIIHKQCQKQISPLSNIICPLFTPVSLTNENFRLNYSLEQASKQHIMPDQIGLCVVLPLQNISQSSNKIHFLAKCTPWDATLTDQNHTWLVTADLSRNNQGFYNITGWTMDNQSINYHTIVSDPAIIRQLEDKLALRQEALIRAYSN